MRVLADENIPLAREAFSEWGEVVTAAGRDLTADDVRDVDVLVVRSVARVDAALLESSRVRFVGTCTIGTDHIDTQFLKQRGIGFASAPGSNAESVAEYVTSALCVLAQRQGCELAGRSIGVVGVGNVGSRVARNARTLGMEVRLNDPPLQRSTGDPKYRPIQELLDVDFLTLHVPLTHSGPDATRHLVDACFLERLNKRTVLINTARGAVVDNTALLRAIVASQIAGAVLDVWEGEPAINWDLLAAIQLGTPHIAGYSYDGKVRATEMIYQAACEFFGRQPSWTAASAVAAGPSEIVRVATGSQSMRQSLSQAVLSGYDIRRDDAELRKSLALNPEERGVYFDRLRKDYPRRREFSNTTVGLVPYSQRCGQTLQALGFCVVSG